VAAWGGGQRTGPGGGAGAKPGVQVPTELDRSPLRRFGHHHSACRNAYRCAALSGWVDERENLIWVMKRPMPSIGIGLGYRLGFIFWMNSTRRNLF
jgi:hypothetical protein